MRSHHYPVSVTVLSRTLSALCVLGCATISISALAEEGADALLAKAAAKLFAAQSLSARFTISTLHPTRYSDTQERGTITLAKPDRARIEITRYRKPVDADRWIASGNGSTIVTDGQTAHTLVWHPQSAQVRTSLATTNPSARIPGGLDPLRSFFEAARTGVQNRSLGEKSWENARYTVVEQTLSGADKSAARGEQEEKREIYIGADGLIHREAVHLVVNGKPVIREIDLRNVCIDPVLSSDAFAFTAPTGATVVEPVAPRPLLAVGAEAPDFPVEDADGKPVHLADFRGKVVLLKFFATWCWTCKESLPGTNALAGKYVNQDVVVLAVDIWNSREAFRAWSAKTPYHAIRFTHDPHPQGTDAASALYHVTTTPTEFVIDRDGKIASVSTGYEGPNAQLENAIAALLAGRPIAQESSQPLAPAPGANH
jgi:peroxiredoxin/outer membrane lipoprotein-sorting protein